MRYGLPYKGSKNKLAERIVRLLPRKTHLVDLFCGGCAVSHAALLMGKYGHIHINDINWMCPTLFLDALSGKYEDDTRWISREDFFRLKDTDPYVAVVWSFGNNMRDYLYSREIEPLKKAIHYAIFFGDYSLGKELGHDFSFISPITSIQGKYLAIKRYFTNMSSDRGGKTRICSKNSTTDYTESSRLQSMEAQERIMLFQKKKYKRPSELQHREHTNSITSLTIPGTTIQPATNIRGGIYQLPTVRLTTPRYKYRMIA